MQKYLSVMAVAAIALALPIISFAYRKKPSYNFKPYSDESKNENFLYL
jgi:hypothetical protein